MQRINFFRAIVLASMTLLFAACGGGRQLDLEPRSQGKQRIGSAEDFRKRRGDGPDRRR